MVTIAHRDSELPFNETKVTPKLEQELAQMFNKRVLQITFANN
jgi:hypothetical protein